MSTKSNIPEQRLENIKALQDKGIDPYRGRFKKASTISEIIDNFKEGKDVQTAGRLMAVRSHGKTTFADLKDANAKVQLYIKKNDLPEEQSEVFKHLDIGDILGVKGELFKTRTGEVTIGVKDLAVLSKNLRPLPEKWHGLKDVETRFRQRYVDLIMSEDVKKIFLMRSSMITSIREFLDKEGYLEVETPMMQAIPGGATAQPFITHHHALDTKLYLRIAPELYLKKLLVGGFEKVYEVNRNFRNEGISTRHNPEFTMLEVYSAYANYEDMMNLTEQLISGLAKKLFNSFKIPFKEGTVDLTPPWKRVSMFELLQAKLKTDFSKTDKTEIKKIAKKLNLDVEQAQTVHEIMDKIFDKEIVPDLVNPTFVIDYPTDMCPLARTKEDDPLVTERFELFVGTQEVANAYTELNDPIEQRKRFEEQVAGHKEEKPAKKQKAKAKDEKIAPQVDEDFLRALEYGMPPAGGLGIGIDRLVMLFCNQESIREVILFPQLRPEKE